MKFETWTECFHSFLSEPCLRALVFVGGADFGVVAVYIMSSSMAWTFTPIVCLIILAKGAVLS
jgi:hypothetical protein